MAKLIALAVLLLSVIGGVLAQDTPSQTSVSLLPPLNANNQIPLLDNRFRIDHEVSDITLVFFRKPGSSSVVLVRPDGSKINLATAYSQGVDWYSDKNYDLIKIKKPMAGPWQALGQIQPQSQIMVLSELELQVTALPSELIAGETLKVTATLTNGGEEITAKDFRELLRLDVLFISSNNADYENFGAGVVQVATFADDGRNFDERARDGVFTGEFKLQMPPGEWLPKYIIKTPLYTRELVQPAVVVHASPVEFVPSLTSLEGGYHQLLFKLNDALIKPESVAVQGKIRFPNSETQSFTLEESSEVGRTLSIANFSAGYYRVDSTLFASMLDGREIVVTLPDTNFFVEALSKASEPVTEEVAPSTAPSTKSVLSQASPDESSAQSDVGASEVPWGLIAVLNLVLLSCGGVVIWMVVTGRSFKELVSKKQIKADVLTSETARNESVKGDGLAQKSSKTDDILELSMPDD